MTSEIRVNKLTNRIGLSTVTFADSGIGVTVTGRIDPDTDSARDLGTTSVRWRNAYVDTYYGDGSNLTGISAGTSLSGSTNNTVCTVTGANAIQGESNFTWTGSALQLTAGTGNQFPFNLRNDFTPNSQRSDLLYAFNGTSNNVLRIGSINSNGGITLQSTRANDSSVKHKLLLNPDGGNIGIGDDSPDRELVVKNGSSNSSIKIEASNAHTSQLFFSDTDAENVARISVFHGSGQATSNAMIFDTAGTTRMAIKSDGQVLIGATSYAGGGNNPALYIRTASANAVKIHKTGSGQSSLQLTCDSGTNPDEGNSTGLQLTQEGTTSYIMNQDNGDMFVLMDGTSTIHHRANGTIKARASMGGANTATYNESVAWNSFSCNSSNGYDFKIINQNSNPAYSYSLELAAAANVNNTNYRHINCTKNSNSAGIFVVYGNGNVANANNSYGSTSDVKLKENIVDANSQWDDVKQLRVRNFNFIADSNKTKLLGLVAQEAETVCPSLVQNVKDLEEDENGNKTETGTVTKELKYSVLYMKAIKALQEAMTRIEKLEQDNIALRARVTNLEGN